MPTSRFRLAIVLCSTLVVWGCATSPKVKKQRKQELQTAVEKFHRAMQWEMIDKATKYVAVGFEEHFRGRYEEYGDDLDIVGLKIERVELGKQRRGASSSPTSATIQVKQRWYVEPDMSVNEEHYVELWKFADNRWQLHDRMPRDEWRDRFESGDTQNKKKPSGDR